MDLLAGKDVGVVVAPEATIVAEGVGVALSPEATTSTMFEGSQGCHGWVLPQVIGWGMPTEMARGTAIVAAWCPQSTPQERGFQAQEDL